MAPEITEWLVRGSVAGLVWLLRAGHGIVKQQRALVVKQQKDLADTQAELEKAKAELEALPIRKGNRGDKWFREVADAMVNANDAPRLIATLTARCEQLEADHARLSRRLAAYELEGAEKLLRVEADPERS